MIGPKLGEGREAEVYAWDADAVVKLYRRWQRYPDVQLDPAEPQVADRLADLASALQAAAAACDDAAAARAAGMAWLKDKDALKFVAQVDWPRLGARVRARPDLELDTLCKLAPSHLESKEWVSKKNRPRKDDQGMLNNPDWSAYYLWKNGEPVTANLQRCPSVARALRSTRSTSVLLALRTLSA